MTDCLSHDDLRQLLRQNLPPRARETAENHVASCARCQLTLDEMTALPHELTVKAATTTNRDPTISSLVKRLRAMSPIDVDGKPEPRGSAPIPETIGPYRVIDHIATGGNGNLYRAHDSTLGRDVAVKVLHSVQLGDEEARHRLLREAKASAGLTHDHVVRVFEINDSPPAPLFMVMEFVDGETVQSRLDRESTLPPVFAATIVRDLAKALSAAHDRGLVHRDVKPSNILLEKQTDRVKLADFGLVLDEDVQTRLTQEGSIAGTPDYMSPEQVRNPHLVDHRSDIYSVGAVFYELLTGEPPFAGVLRMTLLQILHDDPRPPRKLNDAIPRDLETICLKAMEKEPSRRYQTATELADDVTRWLEHRPIVARPISSAERLLRWSRRNSKVAALSFLIAGLLLVMAVGSTLAALRVNHARSAANRQRDAVLETLRTMVFDIHDKLDNDELDLDEVQASLMLAALDGMSRVPETTDTKERVQRMRVAALSRLGIIEYRLLENESAERRLRSAIEVATDLGFPKKNDLGLHRPVSLANWYIGELKEEDGDVNGAIESYSETRRLERMRLDANPTDTEMMHEYMASSLHIASLYRDQHELKKAIDLSLEASEMADRLMRDGTCTECDDDHRVESDALLASVFLEQENLVAARRHATAAIKRHRELDRQAINIRNNDGENDGQDMLDAYPYYFCGLGEAGPIRIAYETLIEIEKREGNLDYARQHIRERYQTLDAMLTEFKKDVSEQILDYREMQEEERDHLRALLKDLE